MALFLLTFCTFLCGIEFVNSIDQLQFWVRDPLFESGRRVLPEPERHSFHHGNKMEKPQVTGNMSHPKNEIVTTPRKKLIFINNSPNAKKMKKQSLRLGVDETWKWSRQPEATSNMSHAKNQKYIKQRRKVITINSPNSKKTTKGSHRMGVDENEIWPRVQKKHNTRYLLRPKSQRKSNILIGLDDQKTMVNYNRASETSSTRMVGDEPLAEHLEKHHKNDTKGDDTEEKLSPYSLKKQLDKFTHEFDEANVTLEVIGRSIEYNDIVLLKVTEKNSDDKRHFRADENKYEDDVLEKKIVFIVHGLSVMGMNHLPCLVKFSWLRQLMLYYFNHLDKFDIFIIPVANPDGYGIVNSRSIWYNKNNSPQSTCNGVALDRNFEVAWNDSGAGNSCSPQYQGPKPFSEPETRAIRDLLHRYSHKIIAYINVHAGTYDSKIKKGDAVLYPKGYTDVQSEDDKYIDLKGEIDEAMKNASFRVFSVSVDTLNSWYGKVSGTSVDYAATVYGIPYALEFVMQPYNDYSIITSKFVPQQEAESKAALEQIWKRIIDVTFNIFYRNNE